MTATDPKRSVAFACHSLLTNSPDAFKLMPFDLDKLIQLAEKHAAMQPVEQDAVDEANSFADEIRAILISAIENQEIESLAELLRIPSVCSWVAFIAMEEGRLDSLGEARCLQVIRDIADSDRVEAIGAQFWLRDRGYLT